ncbi:MULTISPECIES: DUF1566 domain-containing protein [Pseudomonas]|uniref:DUF1566 domain-containing protein n=1 Tax=Pseudomonas TaxID=286 RepID=UPI0005A94438|nr:MULTISPECIES: DUF1566 domain-containing protein [Pseudomonas]AZD93072.1 hypothetical protein C4K13_3655 [Pseudomonas chlororaphis subsp. aureofaciens]KAB0532770.1 DUF1566 domain-containing protein [Pseudomonas chlororaphis subsp. aureofaciens]TSD26042.1 DUF1566 domain-containing protein [Pseudomonas sp. ATCC 13985]WDG57873.1 DUF1566 domain-containing protein [Pseudomonas chlororaphis]WDG64086.1 DUF1566 domain-containing protein [Pseudomonas chlororaphis]
MQMITVSHGETMLTTPDAALALQVLTGLSASAKPAAAPSGIPAIGEYWPGEGGVNGGLFQGGDRPYYLIVPTGEDVEADLEWGGYGQELDGAKSPWDGQANTAYLASSNREHDHPAAQFCANFERDGHKDFYLMARREATHLEITVPHLFSKPWHWTSTQCSAYGAYDMDFEDGWLDDGGKGNERVVRPVRRKLI